MYIVVENNIITEVCCGEKQENKKCIDIPDYFVGCTGDDVRLYDEDFNMRPLKEIFEDGLLKLNDNQKYENGEILEKTLQEKLDDGLIELSIYQKIDNNQIINKSLDELLSEKIITKDEYASKKIPEIRSIRDNLIYSVEWIRSRHNDEKILNEKTTITDSQFIEYLKYINDLRNITSQTNFPFSCVFPTKPTFI